MEKLIMAMKEPNAKKPIDLMGGFVDGKLVSVAKGYRSSKYGRLIKEPPLGTIVYRRLSPEEYKEAEKFLKNSNQ